MQSYLSVMPLKKAPMLSMAKMAGGLGWSRNVLTNAFRVMLLPCPEGAAMKPCSFQVASGMANGTCMSNRERSGVSFRYFLALNALSLVGVVKTPFSVALVFNV